MKFEPENVSFGRHQSFGLRYSWLTKGYIALENDKNIFNSDDATVVLGVGKNMVNAIRYWLIACQIVDDELNPTPYGKAIFDEYTGEDRYLEDQATIWLIHWLLASNPKMATSFYWFFNRFNKPEFSSQEAIASIEEFISEEMFMVRPPAANTVKGDVNLLLRMYSQANLENKGRIEESIDVPLSTLCLLERKKSNDRYSSSPKRYNTLPVEVLALTIISILRNINTKSIDLQKLLYSDGEITAPGTVFRLTEIGLLSKIEQLVETYPQLFELREVAGKNQIYMLNDTVKPEHMIKHYANRRV